MLRSGRSPGQGQGNPLQYSCLENPTDQGALRASPWCHKSQTQLKQLSTHTGFQLKLVSLLSHAQLFATSCTIAHQALQSMAISRQEHWTGYPFPSPRDFSKLWIEPRSPALEAEPLYSELPGKSLLPISKY